MYGGIKHTLCAVLLVGLTLTTVSSQEVQSNHPIRLVVGKQPGSRKDMVRRAAPTGQPSGFLGRLMSFGRSDDGEDNERVTPLPESEREPADWTGVPYHQPGQRTAPAATRRGNAAPIVDPGNATTRTRAAASASARGAVGPVPTPPSADSLQLPTANSQVIEVGSEPDDFSATFSSRRNSRREVDPLDAELLSPSDRNPQGSQLNETANQPMDSGDPPHVPHHSLSAPQASVAAATPQPKTTSPQPLAAEPTASAAASAKTPTVKTPTVKTPTVKTPPAKTTAETVAQAKPSAGDSSAPSVSSPPSLSTGRTQAAADSGQPALLAAPDTGANQPVPAPTKSNQFASRPQPGYPLSLDAGGVPGAKTPAANDPSESLSLPGTAVAPPVGSGLAMPAETPRGMKENGPAAPGGVRVQQDGPIQLHATAGAAVDGTVASDAQMNARSPQAAEGQLASVPAEVPGLRVIAEGPSQIMIRQLTQYEIRVENRGAVEAPGVLVRTAIPQWIGVRGNTASRGQVDLEQDAGARQLLWKIDALPAGAVERLTLQVQAEKSGSFGVAVDWTLLPQKNNLLVNVREPKLQLLIEGPDQVVFGESETYKVRVLNPGDGTAPNVVFTLSPNSATPQTQQIGSIPPGKEAHFEVELTAQDLGDLQIHGLATGDLELRTEGTKTIRVAAADLEAVLTGPPLRYQNGEATYQLKVQNMGVAACRDIVAQLHLPVGIEYVGGLQDVENNGETLRWAIDQLEPGAVRDYEFRCQLSNTGAHLLAFECQGTAAGRAAVSLTTRVEALADLVLTINDPPAPAPIGQDVVYELVIANRGSKAADDIKALTHFSDHIEPIRVEGHSGEITVGQVLLDPIARIEPGQSVTIRIIAQANQEGHHRFRAEINCGETILVAEEATRYLSPMNEQISRRSSETTNW